MEQKKRIATVTINPTIDTSTRVDRVVAEKKLRCEAPRRDPGGGGINVSRAIRRLGGNSTVVYVAGGPTGEILRLLLDREGLTQCVVPIREWTRDNLSVVEEVSNHQYRFGMPGPRIEEDEWRAVLAAVESLDAPDYIVASGSLSPGVPIDFYARVGEIAKKHGARLVVDTSGEALEEVAKSGAYLLKPNLGELRELVGADLRTEAEQKAAARDLIAKGACEVLVVSLGPGGALLVTADDARYIRTPAVPIRSKVGAGDSMVGGVVLALARGLDLLDAVRFGIATGAATVMQDGTELCRREDVERLWGELRESSGQTQESGVGSQESGGGS